jgi:hypothetical protein
MPDFRLATALAGFNLFQNGESNLFDFAKSTSQLMSSERV